MYYLKPQLQKDETIEDRTKTIKNIFVNIVKKSLFNKDNVIELKKRGEE